MANRVKKAKTSDAAIVMVRLPDALKARLVAMAETNGRSMTSEVVAAIEEHLERPTRLDEVVAFIEKYRKTIERLDEIIDWLEGDLYQDIEKLKGTVSEIDYEMHPMKYQDDD